MKAQCCSSGYVKFKNLTPDILCKFVAVVQCLVSTMVVCPVAPAVCWEMVMVMAASFRICDIIRCLDFAIICVFMSRIYTVKARDRGIRPHSGAGHGHWPVPTGVQGTGGQDQPIPSAH